MPKPLELRKLVRILKKYGIKTLILPYALDDMIEKFDLPGNVFDRQGILLKRITFNKDVLCGRPHIRGLRISVEMVLELLAKGATEQEILEDYPELEPDDLRAALLYAHHMVAREDVFDRAAAQ